MYKNKNKNIIEITVAGQLRQLKAVYTKPPCYPIEIISLLTNKWEYYEYFEQSITNEPINGSIMSILNNLLLMNQ